MKNHKQFWSWAAMAGLVFLLHVPSSAEAQDTPGTQVSEDSQAATDSQDANVQDPPSRVSRLNYTEGSVSFQPSGENDWADAVPNRPLAPGDNLWADENSRAELHIGSTALRLGPQTGITLLDLSDQAAQIRLAQGSLFVKVRHVDGNDSYEVDTPNVAFTILQPGDYRMDVDPDGNRTDVTVWRGRGEVTGAGSSYAIAANQHASFIGTGNGNDELAYDFGPVPADDGFDRWALARDQNEDRFDSANYVSPEMTGYEDLAQYGDWSDEAGYGTVWTPRVLAAGWAPYRFGHWIWVGSWGWTWMADEPWGFAPFHYGRWALAANGWVWVPGPRMARPAYAPALVGWVGGTPGFRFSAGVGVGWFPLAPGEVFVPGYRVSRAYVNRVNLTNTTVNVTKVTNIYNSVAVSRNASGIAYVNRDVNGGVTVVSRDTFVNARPVARNVVQIPEKELAAIPASNKVSLEPERSSVMGASRLAANHPPAAVMTRPVVALRTPAPTPHSLGPRPAGADQATSTAQAPLQQSLVRQVPPGRPVPVPATRQPLRQDGFRSVSLSSEGNPTKPQPRVWEEQGTPEPEKNAQSQPANRNSQPSNSRTPQQAQRGSASQGSHATSAKPVASAQRNEPQSREPEQKSSWLPKPASSTPQKEPSSHPSTSTPPPKK